MYILQSRWQRCTFHPATLDSKDVLISPLLSCLCIPLLEAAARSKNSLSRYCSWQLQRNLVLARADLSWVKPWTKRDHLSTRNTSKRRFLMCPVIWSPIISYWYASNLLGIRNRLSLDSAEFLFFQHQTPRKTINFRITSGDFVKSVEGKWVEALTERLCHFCSAGS